MAIEYVLIVSNCKTIIVDTWFYLQIIVPTSYQTKNGSKFKARALQYCLEENVNKLSDSNWIVHLDEETILTESSIKGILNFIMEDKHQLGQGLITYANDGVTNWFTTLADCLRVSDDLGKNRLQLKTLHRPFFGWKGSFMVVKFAVERKITFDHGPSGSISEDCAFALMAYKEGYTFDYIDGEMWERSPYTIGDFIQQRKRWIQGLLLITYKREVPINVKWLLAISVHSWALAPICSISLIVSLVLPQVVPYFMKFVYGFMGGISLIFICLGYSNHSPLRKVAFFEWSCISLELSL